MIKAFQIVTRNGSEPEVVGVGSLNADNLQVEVYQDDEGILNVVVHDTPGWPK